MVVYIAGPLKIGEPSFVLRKVIDEAETCYCAGHAPILPHFNTLFWNMVYPHTRDVWLEMDKQILAKCDAFLRIPGESEGADKEEEWARKMGIQIIKNPFDLE